MNLLGNIIWLLFGGLAIAVEYFVSGLALCVTIVGIPFGFQAFKMGLLALFPFGQTSVVSEHGSGCLSALMNILWFFLGGIWIALTHLAFGLLLCITVIGIPLGLQCFKFARLALFPFGKEIVYGGPSVCGFLANVLWLLLFGWSLALLSGALGLVLCVTVVGIPFGLQCFKFSKLALMPFGASVR